MMSTPADLRRHIFGKRTILLAGIVVVLALAATLVASGIVNRPIGTQPLGASSPTSPVGVWVGTTFGRHERSSKWLSLGHTVRGDYWFRVDASGNVSGHATVVYEPRSNVDGVNAMISYAKTAESSIIGAIPLAGLAALNSAALATMIGVQVSFADPMPVRSGAITGSLGNDGLTLRWADGAEVAMPAKFVLAFMGGKADQVLSEQRVDPQPPWPGFAKLVAQDGVWQAIATSASSTPDDGGVTDVSTSHWAAHRIGD